MDHASPAGGKESDAGTLEKSGSFSYKTKQELTIQHSNDTFRSLSQSSENLN
jgi:hypothetical protein